MKMEGAVGPSTSSSHSHSHSRPVRAASRIYYNYNSPANANTFSGPVRKWEKKWVHVASSQPSTPKTSKQSNGPKTSKSPLLCKWTPLSRSSTTGDQSSGELPRRKFRYTPIVVHEEQKKLASKRVADEDESGEARQSATAKRLAIDGDDIYGMLDINNDLMGADQEPNKSFVAHHSSSRSHFNFRSYPDNQNKDGSLNVVKF